MAHLTNRGSASLRSLPGKQALLQNRNFLFKCARRSKTGYNESFNYRVDAEANAAWGWGSANVKGGISGGTNATREQMAKNISNATQKHASTASAKRDMQINTSYEVKQETGQETSIERTIENINVSRTLNFVFRQMNQEFVTLLHLVDVRLAYYREEIDETNPDPRQRAVFTYQEATLPQLDALLERVIVPQRVQEVRQNILAQLENIFDYQYVHHNFIESSPLKDRDGNPILNSGYLRLKKDYVSKYVDPATGTEITVPGIILAADKHVLRTEGVIVEALLGQGDALDAYSHGLQDEAVKAQQLKNAQTQVEIEKSRLAMKIIQEKDSDAAKLYEQIYPCCPEKSFTASVTVDKGRGDGRPDEEPR